MHIYEENFDEVTAPNLPTGWSTSSSQEGVPVWVTSTTDPFSPPNCAFGAEPPDSKLEGFLILQSPKIRIPNNGAIMTFQNSYNFETNPPFVQAIAFQGTQILAGGQFTMLAPNEGTTYTRAGIVRLNGNGTVDTSFTANINLEGFINTIVVQPDNRILIGGNFTNINGIPRLNIARLMTDGSVDPTFQLDTDSSVQQIIFVDSSHIYAVGAFTMIGGQSLPQIAKFDIHGVLNLGFTPNPDGPGTLAIVAQPQTPSGFKIIVSGFFQNIGGQAINLVARLNPDTGAADPLFNPNTADPPSSLTLQPNSNQIIMGGFFSLGTQFGLARLNSDGTADMSFTPNIDFNVTSVAIQPGTSMDKILITGLFENVNLSPKKFCARLNQDGTTDNTYTADLDNPGFVIAYHSTAGIFIGGTFQKINTIPRNYMAKTNSTTGAVQNFDPNFTFSGAATSGIFMRISLDEGVTFKPITDVGATFLTGGYNVNLFNVLSPTNFNEAWSGNSEGYVTTSVLLPSNLHASKFFTSDEEDAIPTKSVIFQWVVAIFGPNPPPNAGSRIDNIVIETLPICVHPDMKVALKNGGYKLVKEIIPGDILMTRKGKPSTVVVNHRNDKPHHSLVTFCENSISYGVPNKPLLITSKHPIVVKGKYVKPLALVNGKNIIKSKTKKPVHTHTLITDNGLPVLIHNVEVSTWHINSWIQKENAYEVNDYI